MSDLSSSSFIIDIDLARTRMMSPDVKHPGDVKHGSLGPPRRKRIHVTEEDTGLKVLYDPKGETQVEYEDSFPLSYEIPTKR
jgi:hypothetical protein